MYVVPTTRHRSHTDTLAHTGTVAAEVRVGVFEVWGRPPEVAGASSAHPVTLRLPGPSSGIPRPPPPRKEGGSRRSFGGRTAGGVAPPSILTVSLFTGHRSHLSRTSAVPPSGAGCRPPSLSLIFTPPRSSTAAPSTTGLFGVDWGADTWEPAACMGEARVKEPSHRQPLPYIPARGVGGGAGEQGRGGGGRRQRSGPILGLRSLGPSTVVVVPFLDDWTLN